MKSLPWITMEIRVLMRARTELKLFVFTYIHVHSKDQGCTNGEEPILVVPYIELNKNIQVV